MDLTCTTKLILNSNWNIHQICLKVYSTVDIVSKANGHHTVVSCIPWHRSVMCLKHHGIPWYDLGQVQEAGLGQIAAWSPLRDLRACEPEARMRDFQVRHPAVHCLGQSNRRERPAFFGICYNSLGGPVMTSGPTNRIIPRKSTAPNSQWGHEDLTWTVADHSPGLAWVTWVDAYV